MWNELVDILRQPASKRLGLAICVSAVAHVFFFGNMDFSLPALKKEMHLIEARIQMPKVVLKKLETPPLEILQPEETVIAEAKPIVEASPTANIDDLSQVTEERPEDPASDTVEAISKPEPIVPPQNNDELAATEESVQPVDIGLVINENAYQYIETEFDVRTVIDGGVEGKAKITYSLLDNQQYQISWLTAGTGIMALLFPELLQTSEGKLTKFGLQPNHYLYQFGKKADKTRSASFDWQAKKVILQTAKGTKTEDLPDATQDLLSFMYQFMYVAPLQHMQLPIVNGKKLSIYDYSFEGEEQVNSSLGELRALHILHSGSNQEEKTELWLAIDYQYVPVKIRKIEGDGSVVEMLATRITTNRPVIDP
jgi:hypothetical protein